MRRRRNVWAADASDPYLKDPGRLLSESIKMAEYEASTYGERIAEVYDDWYASQDTEGAVEFLCGLASVGKALELGIGTGRVALPLAARGVKVHGIDASPAMIQKLRTKPGGENIYQ